jgi:nonsense-mediated mRNA decay protein 3
MLCLCIICFHTKYALADVQVARTSDFGRNDTVFFARSHLGNILNPGDYVLG